MPGLFYTMEFKNVEDTFVKVLIGDTRVAEADVPVIIKLDPAGSPLKLITVDNGESKFNSIRAQQAIITFHSNSQTSLQTFSDGPDDRFPVTILYGTKIVFYGFLSLADNYEPFLPPRNEVTLVANDKLAALKDADLKDFDNFNPQGKYKIGNILGMCLQKTGKDLRINVINNLRHGTGQKSFMASFGSPSAPFITMENVNTKFFYKGQVVQVSGTASNNVEFTVISVNTGFVGVIGTGATFIAEDIVATFTDVTSLTHIYSQYLDAKTFEKAIGESENCYDVISKILGYDCFITQYNEHWWICRVDEYDNNEFYVARFDENGEFEDIYIDNNLLKNIGFNQLHWLSDEATNVLPTRPAGFAKLIYNFTYPLELICNQDFSRSSGTAVDDTNPSQTIENTLDCWEFLREGAVPADLDQAPSVGSIGVLQTMYEYGYERERFAVVRQAAGFRHYFKSGPLDVNIKDKLSISFDWRTENDETITNVNMAHIRLIGDDGTIWDWAYDGPSNVNSWTQKVITDTVFDTTWRDDASGVDTTEWRGMSNESLPMPRSGKLYIRLYSGLPDTIKLYFGNLNVTYTPFTNGTYRQYNGRYEKVTRDEDGYLAKVDDEVFISDALSKLFKGAIHFFNDDDYHLTTKWYDASKTALAYPTDLDTVKPYGKHQVFSVWNQHRLANTIYQFKFQGFGDDIPSLVHKYTVTDVSWSSLNRRFMMLTKEADLFLCEMTGTMEQVYHTVEGKIYTDPHEFKFI